MRRLSLLLLVAFLGGCDTDVSGPGNSLLACLYANPDAFASGQVLQTEGGGNQGICLPDDAGTGSYVYIPFFATANPSDDEDAALPLTLRAIGLAPGSASGSQASTAGDVRLRLDGPGARAASRLPPADWAFHDRLRRREIRELEPKIRAGAPAGTATAAGLTARDVPQVGDVAQYNVAISCTEEDLRSGRVMYVSDHAVVVADEQNPAGFTSSDYAYFGITFDTLVHPVETEHFGEPTDIDGNGRAILFFTRAVNQLNRQNAESITIGFFWSGDLFPATSTDRLEACPGGNDAEMFYLLAPDPFGQAGPRFTLEDVRQLAIPLIGHEFQHLINASRRLYVNTAVTFEEPWLNEGLSHAAEELLFYAVAGLEPLANLTADDLRQTDGGVDAFNEFMGGNLTNFQLFLAKPDTASLMGVDNLSTRGASWAFLRYAADRSGQGDASFFFDVVNSREGGLDNLREALAPADPLDWMHDWTVSVFGDDRVPGLAARYRQPSWHLPAIYEATNIGRYPIKTLSMESSGETRLDLLPGGAAFVLFGVPSGGGLLHVESEGGTPPPTLRGSVLRVP